MAAKKLNTNSNVYTIVYAAVMVIIVAFLLVFVSSSLKEKQDNNVKLDTQKQILSSLNMKNLPDAAATFESTIKGDYLMQADGSLVLNDGEFSTSYKSEFKSGRLHVFEAEVDGQKKYIIPMNGLGLWGEIWGYMALNEDRNSVYGVYFSHASETPGLGGEIAADLFQSRFPGKLVTEAGNVAMTVVKFGKANKSSDYEIDGVSGATITSKGVDAMISTVMAGYLPFLTSGQVADCCGGGDCENCEEGHHHHVE